MNVKGEAGKGEGGQWQGGQGETLAALAAAIPGTLLVALSVVALTLGVIGEPPMWPHADLTLAEAAGAREEAEVTRLIEQGQDPNARYPVRAGLVLERPARLTPLEAAVMNDDEAIARQLLARVAALDATSWVVLRCLAADSPRVAPVLDAYRPSGRPDCAGVKTPWD